MPTGYTACIIDKESPATFNQFVMGCARAFGACITMRDDPQDAEIPDSFEAGSYHKERLEAAEKDMKRLNKMGDKELLMVAESDRRDEIKRLEESLAAALREDEQYGEMLEKVLDLDSLSQSD